MIYHSDNLVVLHVIVLALARSADALSLDALLRRVRQPSPPSAAQASWQYGWPVKLMCALTVSAYFVTAVAKLSGPLGLSWASGHALRSQMAVDAIRKDLLGASPNPVAIRVAGEIDVRADGQRLFRDGRGQVERAARVVLGVRTCAAQPDGRGRHPQRTARGVPESGGIRVV